jgi:serine/threonine protein kinase
MVASRYRLDAEIAKGGMGAVWAATDTKLRRSVAVKLLRGGWMKSDDVRKRFEREAMVVAQLQCQQIVQIFDYGVERDVPFIVMELMQGEDLQQRLKRVKTLSVEDARTIVWSTAKALGVAHVAGIIHRDLKPGNIFILKQGEEELVKVLDFGVARTHDAADDDVKRSSALLGKPVHRIDVSGGETKVGTIVGTPQYMSPEQARGTAMDHRADLWSLGVITYKMLTGKLPYRGKNAAELIVRLCTESFIPATQHAPHLPDEVDTFFERALARDPDERFPNARELAKAFGQLAAVSMPSLQLSLHGGFVSDRSGSYPSMAELTPFSGVTGDSGPRSEPLVPLISVDESEAPEETRATLVSAPTSLVATTSVGDDELQGRSPRRRWLIVGVAALSLAAAALVLARQRGAVQGGGDAAAAAHRPDDPTESSPTSSDVEPSIADHIPEPTTSTSPAPEPEPSAAVDDEPPADKAIPAPRPWRPRTRATPPAPPSPAPKPAAKPVDPFGERL